VLEAGAVLLFAYKPTFLAGRKLIGRINLLAGAFTINLDILTLNLCDEMPRPSSQKELLEGGDWGSNS